MRLDHAIESDTELPIRLCSDVLYRIGLAIVDLLGHHARKSGMRILVVDSFEGFSVIVGFEVTPQAKLRLDK